MTNRPGIDKAIPTQRVFLLSPAKAAGRRGRQLLSERATFDLAARLRTEGAPLAEIFSFISGLYFRGKAAYSGAFARAPKGIAGAYVITACGGLVPADRLMTLARLQKICVGDVHAENLRYRRPLLRDARKLFAQAGGSCEFVLLGSVASPKYVEPLLEIFGERLFFPSDFVGRGDMSRGGLMLRSARAGIELEYVPVANAVLLGARPPKLPKLNYTQLAMAATAGR